MAITAAVPEKLRSLPPEKQQEVLLSVESLVAPPGPKPLRGSLGLWTPLPAAITEDDVTAARREMWVTFPREDV